jgi:hypothetical protein
MSFGYRSLFILSSNASLFSPSMDMHDAASRCVASLFCPFMDQALCLSLISYAPLRVSSVVPAVKAETPSLMCAPLSSLALAVKA